MPTSSHPIVSGTKIRLALLRTVLHGSHHNEFGDAEDREFQEPEYHPGELRGAPAPITFKGQLCPPAPRINRRDFRFLFINLLPPHTKSADKKCLHFYLGTVKRLEVPLRPFKLHKQFCPSSHPLSKFADTKTYEMCNLHLGNSSIPMGDLRRPGDSA